MPLITYALTLILTGPSRVWKYKSISTYPEMDAFPVTWTKLTRCPCQGLMGVCISESDFCEMRVMSESRINNNLGKVFIEEFDSGWDLSGLRTKEGASWGSRLVLP